MSRITKFEDLDCWKAARIMAHQVFSACQQSDVPLTRDNAMTAQLKRAALSVMNNIAEGFGRYSTKDTIRFLDMARASCNEVKSMLYLLSDLHYLPANAISQLHLCVDNAVNLTGGYLRYLHKKLNE